MWEEAAVLVCAKLLLLKETSVLGDISSIYISIGITFNKAYGGAAVQVGESVLGADGKCVCVDADERGCRCLSGLQRMPCMQEVGHNLCGAPAADGGRRTGGQR